MKRNVAVVVALCLVVGAFAATPAVAKRATPMPVKFFLHGTETVGEVDLVNNFGASYNKMDTSEPPAGAPKSITGLLWTGDPQAWNDCAGMYGLPVWTGTLSGHVKGTMKLTLHTVSAARTLEVEIWPDVQTMQCKSNDFVEGAYPKPVARKRVDLPAGHGEVEIEFKNVNFKAVNSLLLQLTPVSPAAARIFYDSSDFASSLEFKCIPESGRSCT